MLTTTPTSYLVGLFTCFACPAKLYIRRANHLEQKVFGNIQVFGPCNPCIYSKKALHARRLQCIALLHRQIKAVRLQEPLGIVFARTKGVLTTYLGEGARRVSDFNFGLSRRQGLVRYIPLVAFRVAVSMGRPCSDQPSVCATTSVMLQRCMLHARVYCPQVCILNESFLFRSPSFRLPFSFRRRWSAINSLCIPLFIHRLARRS